ncbi:MFS transporter [Umezawaea tangerina]|uniref:EmrB/QacA subfamily drug resistance transporter n=1 Tax=Umezawaea tangerina TaxID=84725 RepID=A0A2T0T6Y6_9PSEU|nr:MFS transporter [Umezawaea tangerina]PRY41439.1 EmrB/QacA subfamily drug resistance transporter [Umezawaea tangerina]
MSTANNPAATATTGPPHPVRRRLVLAICCLSVGVTGINLTIVNVALPSIGRDLHASVSALQWTVDAYSLVMACLLMLSGSMADRFGRKRIFQLGLSLFSLGSLLCGLAPGAGWLIAFCGLQGVGGSMLNPVAMSIIVSVFTDGRERARAIGVWGSVIGVTIAAGPVLGGLLVGGVGWRSVFWVNVPIGIAVLLLTRRFVPESKAARARAFDPAGQALIVVLFASIVAATIEGPHRGWTNPWILGLVVLAVLALLGILTVEPRRSEPLVDLRFFRSPPFSGANAIAVVMSACLGGFLFLNTLYLQDVRHLSPLHAGLMIIPMAAGQAVAATLSGRLLASRGPRLPLTLGGALLAVGAFLLVPLAASTGTVHLLAAYAVFGLGAGMTSPPVTNTAVSGMPSDQVGVAGALVASARQFGASIGVAVTGSIVAGTGTGFVDAGHTAWAVLGGCGLVALALGVVSTSGWAKAAAARNGLRLAGAPIPRPRDDRADLAEARTE